MEIRSVSGTSVSRLAASSIPEAVTAGTDESSADSMAQKTSTATAGYISPYLQYDQGARVAVMLFRDTDTGETQDQIPSRRVVEEYRRAAGRPQPETGVKAASDSSGQSATEQAATTGTVNAARGISFASSGTGAASTSTASFAGNGNTASATTVSSAPSPTVPVPGSPAPTGGGSGGGSPGGLVSVTV